MTRVFTGVWCICLRTTTFAAECFITVFTCGGVYAIYS